MKVEIACVLDRSGSMSSIRADAIGGFNAFLDAQKKLPGEANLSLVLFDNDYEKVYESKELSSVPELTAATFVPRGSTALFDAVGRTIDELGSKLEKSTSRPDKVIFVILTDGEENSSREYTQSRIAEMIKHQEEKYSWEFIFLAANQDAFETGAMLNIKGCNTANFAATASGTRDAYKYMSNTVASYRTK